MRPRDNPFASFRLERIPYRFPAGDDWSALLARLQSHAWRGAVVGPHGSGKTNLTEQLLVHLKARGFQPRLARLWDESSTGDQDALIDSIAPDTFLLLDGAEQLDDRRWSRLAGKLSEAPGLIITQHRAGRLPTVLECTTTPALLAALARELGGTPLDDAPALFAQHGGNVRECLRALYDRAASLHTHSG